MLSWLLQKMSIVFVDIFFPMFTVLLVICLDMEQPLLRRFEDGELIEAIRSLLTRYNCKGLA